MQTGEVCPLLPCADFVVLRPEEAITRVGSIVLAPAAEQWSKRGVVVAVGPDLGDDLSVGTRVFYANWISEVELKGTRWRIVRADDLLGIIA